MSIITDALFSKATKAVLNMTFGHAQGVHLRALMNKTGLGSASAQRELKKLTEAGILIKEEVGKVLLYKPNASSPVYAELYSLLQKTEGLAPQLRDALLPYAGDITRAFIYGSVAKKEDTSRSDIDVLVISDTIGSADLYPVLTALEKKIERKVSLTVYKTGEYRRKLEAGNHFLVSILSGPVIELIGEADAKQRD
nr:nucleotidyltransferase domain-containing protein [uncultured Noviherbaspirillum sp.]